MTKLSIIVPIYKVEKYIENCIKSILNQSFDDFELILVDDGSPDKCGEICDNYAKIDDRIKVIHQKNGGLSSARNSGLKVAIGSYIGFVDSDDWIESTMYEDMYKLAVKYNADIVQCDFINAIDESIKVKNNTECYSIIDNIECLNNLYNEKFIKTVVSWNKIYKRELFEEINFPTGKIHEDEFTTHKLIYKSNKIITLDKKLYYYRTTENSIMNSEFNIKRFHRLEAIQERIEFFKVINEKELYNKTIDKYIFVAKDYYFKYKKSKEYDCNMLKTIKSNYINVFNLHLKNKPLKIKSNFMNYVFLVSPNIYEMIGRKK